MSSATNDRIDGAPTSSEKVSPSPSLRFLKLAPATEANVGNNEASRIASRIVSSIPGDVSELVQMACAIEAIEEKEEYASWPNRWQIAGIRNGLLKEVTLLCAEVHLTGIQRTRYQELCEFPRLLKGITHGFTRKLRVGDEQSTNEIGTKSNKQEFIDELMKAGRRESTVADEASAIDEPNVVHVALSYKHANKFDAGSTIDCETAKKTYEIICEQLDNAGCVRIWIDQNLHRYDEEGKLLPWYERGFLPYAVMAVVSSLGNYGGFAIGCKRPWIWAETGLAVSALGIHCKLDIRSTIEELFVYPQNSEEKTRKAFERKGTIIGTGMSVFESILQVLRSVSCWTPDMLSHKDYDHASEFKEFTQWAKAQVARLKRKGRLDLSTDKFKETILEDICWMRRLPGDLSLRQQLQSPYLRLEMDVEKARKQLALLQASGKCLKHGNLYELVGQHSGLENFCFTVSSDKLYLNINPSQRPWNLRIADAEGCKERDTDLDAMKTWRGGYCLWNRRFPVHELPRFINCGTIFGRHYGFRHSLGEVGRDVMLGGLRFTREGFTSMGIRVEGVYVCRSSHGVTHLCESDVLCIRDLSEDLQREVIMALSPGEAFPSMARILKVESDITNLTLTNRTMGTTSADIELATWRVEGEAVGNDEINIRRFWFGEYLNMISVADDRFGRMVYTFETTVMLEASLGDLLHFKTEGDIDMTLSKVRLMMGSDEFKSYAKDGLSLGIGIYDGNEKYPLEFRLEGSEFMLCDKCKEIYSPINSMVCVISSNLRTGKIRAEWGKVHKCSGRGQSCNITGTIE